ncbi:MAG: hypothetical protein C0524_04355 [Rhodobacter sp.]|nr:hypothetical protein [Rhodobacter sp.]
MIASSLFVTDDIDITSEGLIESIKTVALALILICVVRSPDRFAAAIAGIPCAASFLSLVTIYQAVVGSMGMSSCDTQATMSCIRAGKSQRFASVALSESRTIMRKFCFWPIR